MSVNKTIKSADPKTGRLFIISGPSQIGKDSIVKLIHRDYSLNLTHVITNTTRAKRPGERHRVYINFLTETEFQRLIDRDELLEWAIPYRDLEARYGTPKTPVLTALNKGQNVILNIDTQGALQIKNKMPETILIFITAESPQEVKRRIFASSKMTLAAKESRWRQAVEELKKQPYYDYTVINRLGKLRDTVNQVRNIIRQKITRTI